jgi:hypothetical protein
LYVKEGRKEGRVSLKKGRILRPKEEKLGKKLGKKDRMICQGRKAGRRGIPEEGQDAKEERKKGRKEGYIKEKGRERLYTSFLLFVLPAFLPSSFLPSSFLPSSLLPSFSSSLSWLYCLLSLHTFLSVRPFFLFI